MRASLLSRTEAAHDDSVWSCAWSPAGVSTLVTGSVDESVKLWSEAGDSLEQKHHLVRGRGGGGVIQAGSREHKQDNGCRQQASLPAPLLPATPPLPAASSNPSHLSFLLVPARPPSPPPPPLRPPPPRPRAPYFLHHASGRSTLHYCKHAMHQVGAGGRSTRPQQFLPDSTLDALSILSARQFTNIPPSETWGLAFAPAGAAGGSDGSDGGPKLLLAVAGGSANCVRLLDVTAQVGARAPARGVHSHAYVCI